jgi:hypothetical protein
MIVMTKSPIEAGPETDRKLLALLPEGRPDRCRGLCPSRNLEDALLLAESFGLFSRYDCLLGMEDGAYCVYDPLWEQDDPNSTPVLARASSAGLAICRAILAVAEQIEAHERVAL